MIVSTYDPANNQQIYSTVGSFGHELVKIKNFEEIKTQQIVFCVDKQTAQEVGNLYFCTPLESFRHLPHATYVFGENNSQKLAREIIKAMETSKKDIHILTIPGKTLWAESAMAIVLYHYSLNEI